MGQSCVEDAGCPAELYVIWQWEPGVTDEVRDGDKNVLQPPMSRPCPPTTLKMKNKLKHARNLCTIMSSR
jgi:hypothetical protein